MALKGISKVMFLILIWAINYEVEGVINISEYEDMMLEKQLNILNKPPIKTFQTEWGDILDCIDMHKQPAFDHPSLKNHKIQIKPTFWSNSEAKKTSSSKTEETNIMSHIQCPEGTVPIKRTTKEDLIRVKSLSLKMDHNNNSDNGFANSNQHFGVLKLGLVNEPLYGGNAIMNVYNPRVDDDQFSGAQMWILSGPPDQLNHVQAGWIVFPKLYNDKLTRYFGYWTGDGNHKTGCFDMFCSGFVQTHKSHYLGEPIMRTSTPEAVIETSISIFQDPKTVHWWLQVDDYLLGYWPNSLFTYLSKGGEYVHWGGHVKEGANGISPDMGNGHLPDKEVSTSCYMRNLKYISGDRKLVDLHGYNKHKNVEMFTNADCNIYDAVYQGDIQYSNYLLFGGSAGRCT